MMSLNLSRLCKKYCWSLCPDTVHSDLAIVKPVPRDFDKLSDNCMHYRLHAGWTGTFVVVKRMSRSLICLLQTLCNNQGKTRMQKLLTRKADASHI